MLPLVYSEKTDIGRQRQINEDAVSSLVWHTKSSENEYSYGIFVVADGMGGYDKGEIASALATKKVMEDIVDTLIHKNDNTNIDFKKILIDAVSTANKEVWEISKNEPNNIGTTIVAVIIADRQVYIANVGDSRAYFVKSNKSIQRLTKDHSVVQEMLDAKIITEEQAKDHPRKNIITKALGLNEKITPDIFVQEINDETLVLCTDGLYNMLEEKEIAKDINKNISKSVNNLIALANKRGGIDNISLIVARYTK